MIPYWLLFGVFMHLWPQTAGPLAVFRPADPPAVDFTIELSVTAPAVETLTPDRAAWPWPASVEPVWPEDERPQGVVPIVIIEP